MKAEDLHVGMVVWTKNKAGPQCWHVVALGWDAVDVFGDAMVFLHQKYRDAILATGDADMTWSGDWRDRFDWEKSGLLYPTEERAAEAE